MNANRRQRTRVIRQPGCLPEDAAATRKSSLERSDPVRTSRGWEGEISVMSVMEKLVQDVPV